jgi:hypothetical protein
MTGNASFVKVRYIRSAKCGKSADACANVSFARSRNTASFRTRGTRDPESRGKYMLLWIPGFAGMTARLPSWMPGPRPGMTRGRDAG